MNTMDHFVFWLTLELMVTPIQANSAIYVGCFRDFENDRTLGHYHLNNMDPNGAAYCSSVCKAKGFRYAGTEYHSHCLCDNEIRSQLSREVSSGVCDKSCNNNEDEICGGYWTISIYDTWPSQNGFIGCYTDINSYRTLYEIFVGLNQNGAQQCTSFCSQQGFRYAGTEYANECHCGNTIRGQKNRLVECNYPCKNNWEELCGGSHRISIYDTWQCAKQPCQHGGICSDINAKKYTCSCYPPWTGFQCETEVTTTTTSSTFLSTSTRELTTTADLVVLTGTTFGPNVANSTRLYEKQKDTEDQTVVTTYISVACGVVVMVVVIIIVLLIYRRRKSTARNQGVKVLQTEETINETEYDEPNSVSFINVDTSSRRTTLYDNEHVLMTADGEHVNIEFHATKFTDNCDDYYTLSFTGKSAVPGFGSITRPNQRKNDGENTYSHLDEQPNEITSSDTYSRVTRSRLNDKARVCDSTYSHVGQTATQSMAIENGMPPDGVYNTLNTIPKTTARRKNISSSKAISDVNGNQHHNIATTDDVNRVGLDENNYAHVLGLKRAHLEPQKGIQAMTNTPNIDDNIYAKADRKSKSTNASEHVGVGQSRSRYYIPEQLDEHAHGNDYYNDDNTYYNV